MANRINEMIRIEPLLNAFTTAASTGLSHKIRVDGNDNFAVVVSAAFGATLTTGVTATAANYVQFSVLEGTAATANGSAISGATVTLGAATAGTVRGAPVATLRVSSAMTTALSISINGITYASTLAGAGSSGEAIASHLSSLINGNGSAQKLPHYKAVANWSDTGLIHIEPDDDQGTGLTLITTAAGSDFVPLMTYVQGLIEVDRSKLSTNSPKYIGIAVTTFNGTTGAYSANLVRNPTANPSFPGRVISLTT